MTNDLGHSFAGTVIAKVAEAISDRIRRLIFLNAPVLNDGERFDIQHIFGEGENVAVFGSFTVHSVKLDKTFVSPFSVLANAINVRSRSAGIHPNRKLALRSIASRERSPINFRKVSSLRVEDITKDNKYAKENI